MSGVGSACTALGWVPPTTVMAIGAEGSMPTLLKRYLVPTLLDASGDQTAANRKIYRIDNRFVTARAVQFAPDTGRLAENLVAIALHKRVLDGACELYFCKDAQQREVDFVLEEGRKVTQLIQVCWDMTGADTRQREIRALLQAGADLSCDRMLMLTADADSEEEVEWFGKTGRIRLLPLWRWLSGEGGFE